MYYASRASAKITKHVYERQKKKEMNNRGSKWRTVHGEAEVEVEVEAEAEVFKEAAVVSREGLVKVRRIQEEA